MPQYNLKAGDGVSIEDPALAAIVKRVVNAHKAAAWKALAAQADPDAYPLPKDKNAAEHVFSKYIARMPEELKQRSSARSVKGVSRYEARIASPKFKGGGKIDFRSRVSMSEQISALPLVIKNGVTPFESTRGGSSAVELAVPVLEVLQIKNLLGATQHSPSLPQQDSTKEKTPVPTPVPPRPQTLKFFLHSVECVDETNNEVIWWTEWGSDTIAIGGTTASPASTPSLVSTRAIPRFDVGEFDEGDGRLYVAYSPPRELAAFDIGVGDGWPKVYIVTLVLAEIDWGGFGEFLTNLVNLVRADVVTALTSAVVGGLTGAAAGLVAGAIGAAIGAAVGTIIGWFSSAIQDDLFPPRQLSVVVSETGESSEPTLQRAHISRDGGDGDYIIQYSWQLS